jgi:hypothetical protein
MKKLILPLIILLILVSCREKEPNITPAKDNVLTVLSQSRKNNFSVSDLAYRFQMNMTAIYGDAFTNKSWH